MEKKDLTDIQKELLQEFYSLPATKVIFNKSERGNLWSKATARSNDLNFDLLKEKCPALEHQIRRSYTSGHNIQSAVFSECVYAQTLANMMGLNIFINCWENSNYLSPNITGLLSQKHLVPRYIYSSQDKSKMIIQAGGCVGVDCAIVKIEKSEIYTIEFKEPGAKTSEPDLPKYKEDGVLVVTEKWLDANPQFEAMLKEQEGLNFFEVMGSNINNFSVESIEKAVSNNYSSQRKYANVICTEDKEGTFVMIPTEQVSIWANIEGEIRPAGRNHYNVWTPLALQRFLLQKGAVIDGDNVKIKKSNLEVRRARGGNRQVSGYKITPLFFIYKDYCIENDGELSFKINDIQQLNPTIAGKMFFKRLLHKEVKKYYIGD